MTALASHTILYVDDNEGTRQALLGIFRHEGFVVREAGSGSEALRLAEEKPDLIILDVNLPDINGFEVCRQIKAHPATASIPVLHLSGYFIRSEEKVRGLESGADAYLVKPVAPEELIAHAKALLRIREAEERERAAAQQWQATFDAISDGVSLLDRNGRVLRCNQALLRMLGRPAEQVVGAMALELLPPVAAAASASPFYRMLQTRQRESAEVWHEGRWFQVSADPLPAADGSVQGAVYVVADITERKRLEEHLHQAQ
jgi:PAS domain S-box-containing protein